MNHAEIYILSKTFDNGTICASEQSVVVDQAVVDQAVAEQVLDRFIAQGAYLLSDEEKRKVEAVAIDEKRGSMSAAVVGQSAQKIAEVTGIHVPQGTKLLLARLNEVGPQEPLSREKLSPILGFYVARSPEEAIDLCDRLVHFGGLGHSSGIFSRNQDIIHSFSSRVKTSRILENVPTSLGAIVDIYNRMNPSLTLGCGAYGGNSTNDNVGVRNLLNIKRQSTRKGQRALIVTDPTMVRLGYTDRVEHYLKQAGLHVEIFSDVEPDPSTDTVHRGVEFMAGGRREQPDRRDPGLAHQAQRAGRLCGMRHQA
ncbi:MAG: iron-containing alcohol dehydrogenase [Chloroflexi bacterium]|nr:iron-containing alcohol dehydrogenase [Chloroflexota bacterium]